MPVGNPLSDDQANSFAGACNAMAANTCTAADAQAIANKLNTAGTPSELQKLKYVLDYLKSLGM